MGQGANRQAAKRRQILSLGREPTLWGRAPFRQAAKRRQILSLGREPTLWGRPTFRQAAKRRQILSLGREPTWWGRAPFRQAAKRRQILRQTWFVMYLNSVGKSSPEGATDCGRGVSRDHRHWIICRRFAASSFFQPSILGLTPQAMNLSLLRSSHRTAYCGGYESVAPSELPSHRLMSGAVNRPLSSGCANSRAILFPGGGGP